MVEERKHSGNTDIVYRKPVDGFTRFAPDEGQQYCEGVAVILLRVDGHIALRDKMLSKKTAKPRAYGCPIIHGLDRLRND